MNVADAGGWYHETSGGYTVDRNGSHAAARAEYVFILEKSSRHGSLDGAVRGRLEIVKQDPAWLERLERGTMVK